MGLARSCGPSRATPRFSARNVAGQPPLRYAHPQCSRFQTVAYGRTEMVTHANSAPRGLFTRMPMRKFSSLASWRDEMRECFVPLDVDARQRVDFESYAASETFGCLQVTELLTVAEQRARRTRALASRADAAQVKLSLQLSGTSSVTQNGRRVVLSPGRWAFYDTSRPYEVEASANARFVVLRAPTWFVTSAESWSEKCAAVGYGAVDDNCKIAISVMRSFLSTGIALPSQVVAQTAHLVLRLFSLSFENGTQQPVPIRLHDVRKAQLRSILEYIEEHIDDCSLCTSCLAQHFRVSRRYLYELFALRNMSPGAYIQTRRLERCKILLMGDSSDTRINTLAQTHGFSGSASFGRAFKRTFGLSPREFRQKAR